MKKMLAVLLACLLMVGCSSTGSSSDPLTLPQFEEKYKRAAWDEMLASPMEFINDLHSIYTLPFEQAVPDAADLESEVESYGTTYKKDIVLFNRTFTIYITDYEEFWGCHLSYEGDSEECYNSFRTMFESIIKAEGDPTILSVSSEDVDEAAFRKALDSNDLDASLSAHWTKKSGDSEVTVALISYWNFTGGTLSIW